MANYLAWMQARLPETEFVHIVSFPNWDYREFPGTGGYRALGDYAAVLDTLMTTCRQRGVELHGIRIDNPWDYFALPHAKERVDELMSQAEHWGLDISFYVNTDNGLHVTRPDLFPNTKTPTQPFGEPRTMTETDREESKLYRENSLALAKFLVETWPGRISSFIFESWHRAPFRAFPLSDELSYAAITADGAKLIAPRTQEESDTAIRLPQVEHHEGDMETMDVQLKGTLGRRFGRNIDYLLWRYNNEADHRLMPFEKREEWYGQRKFDWDGEYAGKWLDAAAISADASRNPDLVKAVTAFANRLRATQKEDGYLGTCTPGTRMEGAFPMWIHWLAMKALRTYGQCFGDDDCIAAAIRGGNWLIDEFAPITDSSNKLYHFPGGDYSTLSWLDEMAELYAITDDEKYLDFAASAMEHHPKFKEMRESGRPSYDHAYNLMTFMGGAVMVADARDDDETLAWLATVWDTIAEHHLFPTGSVSTWEGFGIPPMDLPDAPIHETCATVEWLFFSQRLFEATGDVRYMNMIERTVRNALLGAQKADGTAWTYFTPLSGRRKWLEGPTECCFFSGPRGVARLPMLTYHSDAQSVYINLFESGKAQFALNGETISVQQESRYPEHGDVTLNLALKRPARFRLRVRIPEHTSHHRVMINGKPAELTAHPGEYLDVKRTWSEGDTVRVQFEPDVWLDYLSDGNAVVMRGVQALSVDARNNDMDLKGVRLTDVPSIEAAGPAPDGRPLCRVELPKRGQSVPLLLTPYSEAGNGTEGENETYRSSFPSRAPDKGTGRFCGAQGDTDGRLPGPGVTYRDCEIEIAPWDTEKGCGYMKSLLGGAPFYEHGTVELRLSEPVAANVWAGIGYAYHSIVAHLPAVGILLGQDAIRLVRWPAVPGQEDAPPTWEESFPIGHQGATGLKLQFDETRFTISCDSGSGWVQAASYPLNDVHGEDWSNRSVYIAFPMLLSLGAPMHVDTVTWEGPIQDLNMADTCCSPAKSGGGKESQ